MSVIYRIALTLVIIGALNWGLIGLFQFDLVASIFGGQESFMSRVIYSLVGLSGLVSLGHLFTHDRESDTSVNRRTYSEMDYSTEFGEETDLNELKDKKNK